MPISALDPRALASLTRSDLVAMALERDQESRRLARRGRDLDAAEADRESAALCALFRDRK